MRGAGLLASATLAAAGALCAAPVAPAAGAASGRAVPVDISAARLGSWSPQRAEAAASIRFVRTGAARVLRLADPPGRGGLVAISAPVAAARALRVRASVNLGRQALGTGASRALVSVGTGAGGVSLAAGIVRTPIGLRWAVWATTAGGERRGLRVSRLAATQRRWHRISVSTTWGARTGRLVLTVDGRRVTAVARPTSAARARSVVVGLGPVASAGDTGVAGTTPGSGPGGLPATPGSLPSSPTAPIASRMGIATGGGWHLLSADTLRSRFAAMRANGARWVRFDINWTTIQAGGPQSWNWASHDTMVNAARGAGLDVLATLNRSPVWARPSGAPATDPPTDPQTFARFAAAAVRRYAPKGVRHWEIWNEPNIEAMWSPSPDPVAYTRLLAAAAPQIRAADPGAVIVTGGLAPASDSGTRISPITFLKGMYAAGARASFDALGLHPYCTGILVSVGASWCPWTQMSRTSPSLRGVMADNGDSAKRIWLTEYGAPTAGTGSERFVSEDFQAQMVGDAYATAKVSWIGPMFWYTYIDRSPTRDRYDSMGLFRADGSPKPAWAAYARAAAAE